MSQHIGCSLAAKLVPCADDFCQWLHVYFLGTVSKRKILGYFGCEKAENSRNEFHVKKMMM